MRILNLLNSLKSDLFMPEQMMKLALSPIYFIAKVTFACLTAVTNLVLNRQRRPQVAVMVHPNSPSKALESTTTLYDSTGTKVTGVFYTYAHPNSLKG
jgi:hypothetical protein